MKFSLSRLKFLLLFLCLSSGIITYGQHDIEVLKYKYYTSYFSTTEHIPVIIEYTLTKKMITCKTLLKRTNKFAPDPAHQDLTDLEKDYKGSGYDRGHNMSAADNKCDITGMKECFYFSNMTPQPHSFNAGKWEETEKTEREKAMATGKVIVTTGSIGKAATIGVDKVVVPKFMWKVIYIPSDKTYLCYFFPDTDDVHESLDTYMKTLAEIEKYANVIFEEGMVRLNP